MVGSRVIIVCEKGADETRRGGPPTKTKSPWATKGEGRNPSSIAKPCLIQLGAQNQIQVALGITKWMT